MSVTRFSCVGLLLLASSVSCSLDRYGSPLAQGEGGEAQESSGGAAGAGSVGSGGAGSGGMGGGLPLPPFCDPNDASLLACFRFEGDTLDASGKSNTVTPTNVNLGGGKAGQAGDFQADSQIRIEDAPHWHVSQYTLELWYSQRSYGGTRMGLFDSDGRYGLFVYGAGELRCSRGDAVASMTNMPLDTWTHAACVFDGAKLRLYVNGAQAAEDDAVPPEPDGTGSNALGSNAPSGDSLDGLIDDVRVWNVARSASEICAAAGKQGC